VIGLVDRFSSEVDDDEILTVDRPSVQQIDRDHDVVKSGLSLGTPDKHEQRGKIDLNPGFHHVPFVAALGAIGDPI
jgi:hypothetical protein